MLKICLISCLETGINFFPELKKELLSKILDSNADYYFVEKSLDIPLKAKQEIQTHDLLFAFATFEEGDFREKILLSKLVELEISSGKKIIKAVEEPEFEGLQGDGKEKAKKELSEKYSQEIIDWLFHKEKFEPK